jgi:hypothetical protein
MSKILISAGHQPGLDPGAIGQGKQEADCNIRMCDRIVHYLRTWGVQVIYMPNNVGNLQAEINWANANLKLFEGYAIQIHRNAGGGTGNEVWTTAYEAQIPLATSILKAMTEMTGLRSRGVKDIKTHNWPLGWINHLNAESVLVEARFMDKDDVSDAADFLDGYAIACGIADFLKVPRGKSLEVLAAEAKALAEAQAKAKAEADRLANLARIEAEKQAEIARIAEIARKEAEEKAKQAELDRIKAEAEAKQAEKNAHESDHSFIQVLKELWNLILAFITQKGKQ